MWYHFVNIKIGQLAEYLAKEGSFQHKGQIIWGEVVSEQEMKKILERKKETLSDYDIEIAENNPHISILTPKDWDGIQTELENRDPKAFGFNVDVKRSHLAVIEEFAKSINRDVVVCSPLTDTSKPYGEHLSNFRKVYPGIRDNALIISLINYANQTFFHKNKSIFGHKISLKSIAYPECLGDVAFEKNLPIFEMLDENIVSLLIPIKRETPDFVSSLFEFIKNKLEKNTKLEIAKSSMKAFELLHKKIFVANISKEKRKLHKMELELYYLRKKFYEKNKAITTIKKYIESHEGIKEHETKTAREEWAAILNNPSVKNAYIIGNLFIIVTNTIWMRYKSVDFRIDSFIVTVDLETSTILFKSVEHPEESNIHPHIDNGIPCLGELVNSLPALLGKNEFLFLTEAILLFLKSYNPNSEYHSIFKYEAYSNGVNIKGRDENTDRNRWERRWYKEDNLCILDINTELLEAQAKGLKLPLEKKEIVSAATPVVVETNEITITPDTETRRVVDDRN